MSFVCVHCLSLYAVRFYARNILSLCVCCWCAACYRYYFPPTKRQIWVRVQATNEWLAAIISHHHRAKPKAIDKDRGRERNTRITNRIEYTFTFSRIHLFARSFIRSFVVPIYLHRHAADKYYHFWLQKQQQQPPGLFLSHFARSFVVAFFQLNCSFFLHFFSILSIFRR